MDNQLRKFQDAEAAIWRVLEEVSQKPSFKAELKKRYPDIDWEMVNPKYYYLTPLENIQEKIKDIREGEATVYYP